MKTPENNSTTQKVRLYLVARRKLRSLLDDPRRINANFVVPNFTGQQLSKLANRNLIPPFATATALSSAQHWDKLSNYVLAHEHPLIKPIANYLKSAEPAFDAKTTTNGKIERTLRETEALERLSMRELLSASSFFTQFGFFKASAAFRYAAIAQALNKGRSDSVEARAAQVELAGTDWETLDYIKTLYTSTNQDALETKKSQLSKNGFDSLEALKANNLNEIKRAKYSLTKSCYQELNRLRGRQLNLTGRNILLIGPSVRESKTIERDWPDHVLRIGFRGTDSSAPAMTPPTNISFYKNHKLADLTATQISSLAQNLEHVFVTTPKQETLKKVQDIPNLYISSFGGSILLDASCNAGVEALLCLLDANAKNVYIQNLDLFINNLYPHGYKPNDYQTTTHEHGWSLGDELMCRSMALNHHPIPQYNIFKIFWTNKNITGDKLFENLMEEGLLSYLHRLEATYYPFAPRKTN